MNKWLEVYPAYGRDYKTQKEVKAAWAAGEDFRTYAGPYVNKEDAKREGYKVLVRYANQAKVCGV